MPEEMWVYHWFAKTWHWPPATVRGLSLDECSWLQILTAAEGEARGQLDSD